ncbi:MAG TPA: dihydrolipoyl dehydrogenase [Bacillota bacterium]
MTKTYDVVVLGGGTGGYVAAIRAAQLGKKVAIVEAEKLGGTCLHKGCIPSKALLRSAEVFRKAKATHHFGIETSDVTLNFSRVHARKKKIINHLHEGVRRLMKKRNIDVVKGFGRILGPSIFSPVPGTISVEHKDGRENTMITPEHVLIATGSKPKVLPGLEVDGTFVMTSDEALEMDQLPSSIIIIGAGAIGIEWASLLVDFGVRVTVIEFSAQILPSEDEDVVKEVEKMFVKKGITFVKNAKVLPETFSKEQGITIDAEVDGKRLTFRADKLLIAIGRQAQINNIGLENTDIVVNDGWIETNEFYQTKESHIYAIGDVIGGMQLAHVASQEGIVAVEHMANDNPLTIDYEHMPRCVYAHPEVASIGLTERKAKEKGYRVKVGQFPFKAIGKALVYGDSDGFVKIISNQETDDLLGIHMVGPHVTDLISETSLAKFLDATPWEISQTIHPHPSLSEIIKESALSVEGLQLHR